MLLRIAYCDDEPENGRKMQEFISQLEVQTDIEFVFDYYISGIVLLENLENKLKPLSYESFKKE